MPQNSPKALTLIKMVKGKTVINDNVKCNCARLKTRKYCVWIYYIDLTTILSILAKIQGNLIVIQIVHLVSNFSSEGGRPILSRSDGPPCI